MTAPTIFFLHQNFPGQFRALAGYMVRQGWTVYAAGTSEKYDTQKLTTTREGIQVIGFKRKRDITAGIHRYLKMTEEAILNGQGFANTAIRLKKAGIEPDIVVAHSGWGTGSFAKAIWPEAKFVQYLEWWYTYPERDLLPPKRKKTPGQEADARAYNACRNIPFLLDAMQADAILTPTRYQALDVPDFLRKKLHILHDGVDCSLFSPEGRPDLLKLPTQGLSADHRVITYATRGMEPMRGFPEFMHALSKVQKSHPDVHCVIAGNDSVHYSDWLPEGESYRTRALDAHEYDMSRLHFVGHLELNTYARLLRRSDCHVYLTRPFVLSWSLIEAMASAAPLVVSNTPSVIEALPNAQQALRVDHTDIDALALAITETLDNPEAAKRRGARARKRAQRYYNAAQLLPAHEHLFREILAKV